jgi:ADP-heptose:LPS heptosyltransferase
MENILLIRLKSIGDVILTLPAVNAVRANFPAAKITFLTSKENSPLLRGFREVNKVIGLDRSALRSGNPFRVVPEFLGLLRRLRSGRFSTVVDFQGYGETAWLARFTGAAQRWGYLNRPKRRWAYTRWIMVDPKLHAAAGYLQMLEKCGLKTGAVRNEFSLPETSLADAREWFAVQKLDPARPTLYLQPFTSTPHKNWPFENYLALAKDWRARGVQVIVAGGPADQPSLTQARGLGFAVSSGLPRLTDVGLMKLSTLVVGGDTGFLHLAVALGKRVVMLIRLRESGSVIPFEHPEWVVAPPPGLPLDQVGLDTMVQATGAALAAAATGN